MIRSGRIYDAVSRRVTRTTAVHEDGTRDHDVIAAAFRRAEKGPNGTLGRP